MRRFQCYLEEQLFDQVKQQSRGLGLSMSAYIREVVRKQVKRENQASRAVDFSAFSGIWMDRDVAWQSLRTKAWGLSQS